MYMAPLITAEELVRGLAAKLPDAGDWRTYPASAPRLRFSATVDGAQVRVHVTGVRHARFIRLPDDRIRVIESAGELRLRVTSPNTPDDTRLAFTGALLALQFDRGLTNPWFWRTFDGETLKLMHARGRRNRRDRDAALEALKLKFYGTADVSGDRHRRLVSLLDDYTKWRRGIRLKERPSGDGRYPDEYGDRLVWPVGTRPKRRRRRKPVPEKRPPGRPPKPPRPLRPEIVNMLRWLGGPPVPLEEL